MSGVKWVRPGRLLLRPDVRPAKIPALVAEATSVQFDLPLPAEAMETLAAAMALRPDVALYVYGYTGWGSVGGSLEFLAGFAHVRSLSLALYELGSFDGLARFQHLRKLSLRHSNKLSLGAVAQLPELEDLLLDVPRADASVLSELPRLRRLNMSAARGSLVPLTDHPRLERLWLHNGTERDLSPLATCRRLQDLSIWCITRLDENDLGPVGQIAGLDALVLGGLRNVKSLEPLVGHGSSVRFLELEQLRSLQSLAPIAQLPELRACTIFDSRPADRSLAPLIDAPRLEEVFVGGSSPFPKAEVDLLVGAFQDRLLRYRKLDIGPPDGRLSWRGLFPYTDRARNARS
jgi:hypothetical protein